MNTLPFWQDDITAKLLAGVLAPEQAVENLIELSPAEILQRDANFKSQVFGLPGKFFTIYDPEAIPLEYLENFKAMVTIIMQIESDLGIKFLVTSFFRSMSHHFRVYAAKGITDTTKIPMLSTHLFCNGIDVIIVGMTVKQMHDLFTEEFLERYGLWMEHPAHTPGWGHLQRVPYKSWKPGMSRKYHI